MNEPSSNGDNGRDTLGRFKPGNPGGPGNPNARAVARLRQALVNGLTDEKAEAIARKLIEEAEKGERWAVHEVFDRVCGKAKQETDLTISKGGLNVADMSEEELQRLAAGIVAQVKDPRP